MKMTTILALAALLLSTAPSAGELEEWLEGSVVKQFEPAGPAELKAVGEEFERLFRGEVDEGAWTMLGFRVQRIGPFWALSERDGRGERGSGAYLVRAEGGDGGALQAPHRIADPDIGEIALRLTEQGRFSAAAWNSAPSERRRGDDPDLARRSTSHHTAFARAFARVHPNGVVTQLLGFTGAEGGERLVVGDGSRHPGARLLAVAACLKKGLGDGVRHYPFESASRGGEENAVGRLLRRARFDGFVHLAMDEQTRQRLLNEPTARDALIRCLRPEGESR